MINAVKKLDISEVLTSGRVDDWEVDPDVEGFRHKVFQDLKIIKVLAASENHKECYWKDHCEVKQGVNIEYMVKFREEFISRHFFVEIENIAIVLPLPKLGSKEITTDQLHLAKIINSKINVNDLIEQAKTSIRSLRPSTE